MRVRAGGNHAVAVLAAWRSPAGWVGQAAGGTAAVESPVVLAEGSELLDKLASWPQCCVQLQDSTRSI